MGIRAGHLRCAHPTLQHTWDPTLPYPPTPESDPTLQHTTHREPYPPLQHPNPTLPATHPNPYPPHARPHPHPPPHPTPTLNTPEPGLRSTPPPSPTPDPGAQAHAADLAAGSQDAGFDPLVLGPLPRPQFLWFSGSSSGSLFQARPVLLRRCPRRLPAGRPGGSRRRLARPLRGEARGGGGRRGRPADGRRGGRSATGDGGAPLLPHHLRERAHTGFDHSGGMGHVGGRPAAGDAGAFARGSVSRVFLFSAAPSLFPLF